MDCELRLQFFFARKEFAHACLVEAGLTLCTLCYAEALEKE